MGGGGGGERGGGDAWERSLLVSDGDVTTAECVNSGGAG